PTLRGRAFLEERAQPFLSVVGAGVHRHDGPCEVVGPVFVEVDLGVQLPCQAPRSAGSKPENAGPTAAMTITRTSGSSPSRCSLRISSSISSRLSALRFCGR